MLYIIVGTYMKLKIYNDIQLHIFNILLTNDLNYFVI